jgi:cell division protein FtsL
MNDVQVIDSTDTNFDLARALLLLVGLIALLGLLYLTQSAQATMTGKRVLRLQERLEQLRRENAQLEYEIAVLSAPSRIAERAARLGLRPLTPAQAKYVVITDYPSLPPASPTKSVTGAPPPSTFDVWRDALLSRLGLRVSKSSAAASP